MDPVARRVAWVGRLSRRLAMPVVPVGLPVAWTAIVEDPLANVEAAWEHATAALMPLREEMHREDGRAGGPGNVAAEAPARLQRGSRGFAPREVEATRPGAMPVAAASRPHLSGVPHSPPRNPVSFPYAFERLDRVAEAVVNAEAQRGRQALAPRTGGSSSSREVLTTGGATESPVRGSDTAREPGPAASGTQPAQASSIAPALPQATPSEWPNESPGSGRLRRSAEPGLTRLAQGPAGLARLLQANRDPRAVASSPTPAGLGAEARPARGDARLAREDAWRSSTGAAAAGAANDQAGPGPGPVVTPATMDAILEALADRLRFELMREYGASSD